MKKIFAFFAIFLLNFGGIGGTYVFAEDIKITVTEQIPGLKCDCVATKAMTGPLKPGESRPQVPTACDDPSTRKYKCAIEPGFGSVLLLLSGLIKYATFIVALLGVLMLVYSGIEMSISGVAGKKDDAKKRIEKTLLGLVLLFMIGFILNSVAPWIYQ